MKKNRMMRLASALLVAVLLTTCTISGTFAKYVTTASATDTARVAKWGVSVTATGNDAFAKNYKDVTGDAGVMVKSDVKVVAPGTRGDLCSIKITGTPEVMVNVAMTADLEFEGNWKVAGDDYCPIVFTVTRGSHTKTIGLEGTGAIVSCANIAELEYFVESEFRAISESYIDANTNLATDDKDIEIDWAWPYEVAGDLNGDGVLDNDYKDTTLGDRAVAEDITIIFTCSATVTQVD